jgi:uncharacterized membrane protein
VVRFLVLSGVLVACFTSSHIAITSGHIFTALVIMMTPLVLLAGGGVASRLVMLIGGIAVIFIATRISSDVGLPLLYLPPVIINVGLAVVFGNSLRHGKTPLITRYSVLLRGKLEPAAISYTRNVTYIWTAFFSIMALELVLLAIFAPLNVWSLFANILNYLFALVLFTGEYSFRVRHLKHLEHPGFFRFITSIANVKHNDIAI